MKHSFTTLAMLGAAGAIFLSCSDKPETTAYEAATTPASAAEPTTWDNVKTYTRQRSAEFRDFVDRQVDDLDRKMESLAERTGDEADELKAELALQRDALADKLEALGDATEETWDDARDAVVEQYYKLRDAIQRAFDNP